MIIKKEINNLPTEILQYIFNYLNDTDLTSVSFVSLQWKRACERILRHRCLKQIPENILIEITSEQVQTNLISELLYNKESSNTVSTTKITEEVITDQDSDDNSSREDEEHDSIRIEKTSIDIGQFLRKNSSRLSASNNNCVYVDDYRIFIGNQLGNILSYKIKDVSDELTERNDNLNQQDTYFNCNDNTIKKTSASLEVNLRDGGVTSMVGIPYYSLLLASGQSRMHFFDISNNRLKSLDTDFRILPGKSIKVFGPRFSVRDEAGIIHIYEIFYVGQQVRISKILEVKQNALVLDWQLWDTKLICLLSTGEISVSSLLTYPVVEIYRSVCYSSILYKNPTWIFRDVVFVSTLASRGLINGSEVHTYTYMSDNWNTRDGCGQWFVGGLDQLSDEALLEDEALATSNYAGTQMEIDLIARRNLRGFCLHGHYLGSPVKEEISCVCLRRNLLCFGTISGAVLLFRQIDQDSCDPYADFENSYKLHTREQVTNDRIMNIDIAFTDGDISLVYRTETYIGALNIESELQFFKPYLEQQDILNL